MQVHASLTESNADLYFGHPHAANKEGHQCYGNDV